MGVLTEWLIDGAVRVRPPLPAGAWRVATPASPQQSSARGASHGATATSSRPTPGRSGSSGCR